MMRRTYSGETSACCTWTTCRPFDEEFGDGTSVTIHEGTGAAAVDSVDWHAVATAMRTPISSHGTRALALERSITDVSPHLRRLLGACPIRFLFESIPVIGASVLLRSW